MFIGDDKIIATKYLPLVMLQIALFGAAALKGIGNNYVLVFITMFFLSGIIFLIAERIKADYAFALLVISLILLGGFIQTALSTALYNYESGYKDFMLHMCIGVLAFVLTISGIRFSEKITKVICSDKFCNIAFIFSVVLYLVCLVSGRVGGAANWVFIGGVSLQLTELAKVIYVWNLAIASEKDTFETQGKKILTMYFVNVLFLLVLSEFGFIIVITLLTIAVMVINIEDRKLFFSNIKALLKFVIAVGLVGIIVLLVVLIVSKHNNDLMIVNAISDLFAEIVNKIHTRIVAFIYPDKFLESYGYQGQMINVTMFNGGLLGSNKPINVPVAESDMVLASIIGYMGVIMGGMVICLYLLFFVRGYDISKHKNSRVIMVLVLALFVQAAYNIASVIGIVPISGMTLPFISAGGTSLLCTFIMVAIVFEATSDDSKLLVYGEREKYEYKENILLKNDNYMDNDINDSCTSNQSGSNTRYLSKH